jgi:hypothetical protein
MKVLYGAVEVERSRGYAFYFHFCVLHTYYSYHYQSEFYCILAGEMFRNTRSVL